MMAKWVAKNEWNLDTVEPHYNEVLGTIKITLLYQVSHYIRVKKQRNIKKSMVFTKVCRDTINCKDTIVLCNGAVMVDRYNILNCYNEVALYYKMFE